MSKHDFQPEWADLFSEVQEAMTAWRREHPKATMVAIELETQCFLGCKHVWLPIWRSTVTQRSSPTAHH